MFWRIRLDRLIVEADALDIGMSRSPEVNWKINFENKRRIKLDPAALHLNQIQIICVPLLI
jgi:hypothetical protein